MQVYDITLGAALKLQKCGPQKLCVEGEWKWLLGMFATTYGVCQSYTSLAHVRWIMRWVGSAISTCWLGRYTSGASKRNLAHRSTKAHACVPQKMPPLSMHC